MLNGRRAAAALSATALGLLVPAGAQAAEAFYGVTEANRLVTFQSDTPGAIRSAVPITGLADSDEGIVGIDVRPADGGLYGVGSEGVLYRIDPTSGQATAISQAPGFAARGRSFGVDFNPVADRLRLVSEAGMNVRINPVTGQGLTDTSLAYAAGDANAGKAPAVVAAAYSNNVAGATATELFGLDTTRDALVVQAPPNDGVLRTRGPLGIDARSPAGFDIAASDGRAWAAFNAAGKGDVGLYVLNLNTGRAFRAARSNAIATFTGSKADPLRALASIRATGDDSDPPRVRLLKRSKTSANGLVKGRALRLSVSYNEACTVTADLLLGKRRIGRARAKVVGEAGRLSLRLKLSKRGKRRVLAAGEGKRLRLRINAKDLAGNKTKQR